MIWVDRVAALLLAAIVGLLLLLPPESRPDDLELQVTAENQIPVGNGQQAVEVTVRWRWLRQPRPWFAQPEDGIGIVFDRERWGLIPNSQRMYAGEDLLARLGEPYSWHRFPVPSGEDGELRFTLMAQGEGAASYKAAAVPLRVQYLYVRRGYPGRVEAGWAKGVEGPVVIGGMAEPAGDGRISREEALSRARRYVTAGAGVRWEATYEEHRTLDGKAGRQVFPAWVVEAVYPMGNKQVILIHAVTGEFMGVLQVEAP